MKFLIDTNILIPLEPASLEDTEPSTPRIMSLHSALLEAGHAIFLHPVAKRDLARDRNRERRQFREIHALKYPELPDPPNLTTPLTDTIGQATPGSNDWVDDHLLAAVLEDAVDILVSEDRGIRSKARRLGLEGRVHTIDEALTFVNSLAGIASQPPPAVQAVKAHKIHTQDPILESFRREYPGFDRWFQKCRREHRTTWIIPDRGDFVAGFCIVNVETEPPANLNGKILKICSFKISPRHNGFRYGELLLRAVFEHAEENQFDGIFVTVFEHHEKLTELLFDFGFEALEQRTHLNELILAKELKPPSEATGLAPLEFALRYGPHNFLSEVPWYVVPIRPLFSEVLFPETSDQKPLIQGQHPFGNSIKKAYLCNASITELPQGSLLLFYRSQAHTGAIALGVVEQTFRSKNPNDIARLVGKRTVYSFDEIERLCAREVLAILFRQARSIVPEIPLADMLSNGVLRAPPQSIGQIPEKGKSWLQERLT